MYKLSDIKNVAPLNEFEYTNCPCGIPEECLCNLKNCRRVLGVDFCGRCGCDECKCANRSECYRECRTVNDTGGVLCICSEICTCDIQTECMLLASGCICVPECTCGWNDYCNTNKKSKLLLQACTCGEQCPCANKQDCYRIPFIMKFTDHLTNCTCGPVCECSDRDECYYRNEVKNTALQHCVCGSGLYYADCPCYNKEYCFQGKWPPCACGEVCQCPDRATCFLQSRMAKCKHCDQTCVCGYKDFCDKIQAKKEKCACGLLAGCKCFDQDECIYTDKLVRLPFTFSDEIGWRIKPTRNILPLTYTKYNADGSFKTPYSTSVMIKFLNAHKQVLYKHPFQITASVNELRRDLSILFKLPLQSVVLKSHGQELHQTLIIAELGYKPYDVIELYLRTKELLEPFPDYYVMVIPDIVTVRIKLDDDAIHKNVTVEIYDKRIKKPFLGGFVNKKTKIEYHNAYTQTGLRASKIPPEYQNNRDTQTYWLRNRRQETMYSRGTQMSNNQIYVANVGDRILAYSGSYEDAIAREIRLNVIGKVRTIQRYYRAYRLRQALHRLHAEYWQRVRNAQLNAAEVQAYDLRRKQEEVVRKIYPRSRADYSMLYGMLANWKKAETERICQMFSKAARVAELYLLLDREIQILRLIEKHRREVRADMQTQQEMDFFNEISAPVKWHGYKHLLIEMHTEKTQRAQRYKDLYVTLCRRDLNSDERLTLLLSIKYSLRDHKCRTGAEIVELLDQECELLVRGLTNTDLDMLRKRIQLLILEHVKTVQCNDCLTKRYRGLREINMDTDLIYCKRCEQMKFRHAFPLHSRIQKQTVCTSCTSIDLTLKPFVDIAPYRYMLDWIIRRERRLNTDSCIIYMINERDIQYIVDRIWHGHSLLTETNDLYNLRLERWKQAEAWSPWNCVLLANETAKAHVHVDDPLLMYGEHVCNDVKNKCLLGRKKFVQMFYINEFFQRSGELRDYKETLPYISVPSEIFCNEPCTEKDYGAPCTTDLCLKSNDPEHNVQTSTN